MTYVRKPTPAFSDMQNDEAVMDVSRWKLRNGDDSTPDQEVKFARDHVKSFFGRVKMSFEQMQAKKIEVAKEG